jgi:hypothetical protein
MTKFLNSTFSNYPIVKSSSRPEVQEFGGPAAEIPIGDRCPSGRHNKRINNCLCELFAAE